MMRTGQEYPEKMTVLLPFSSAWLWVFFSFKWNAFQFFWLQKLTLICLQDFWLLCTSTFGWTEASRAGWSFSEFVLLPLLEGPSRKLGCDPGWKQFLLAPCSEVWHLEGASMPDPSFIQVGNPTRLPQPFPLQKSEQAFFIGWKLHGDGNPCSF